MKKEIDDITKAIGIGILSVVVMLFIMFFINAIS